MNHFGRHFRVIASFALIVLSSFSVAPQAQQAPRVDINLVLAIDCSYSVNPQEYALQMAGMASAISDPAIVRAIENGVHGAIAVTVVQWSHKYSQVVVVPWMRIASQRQARLLAAAIARAQRQTAKGATSISGMLDFGQTLIRTAPFISQRNIIDVVADGKNNSGDPVEGMRDRLNANGITINGLAILNEETRLDHYMRSRVIGGNFAFVEQTANYEDFARAIHRKLLREIQGVPIS